MKVLFVLKCFTKASLFDKITAKHLSPLHHKMFPDSKIAKVFSCSQTKTTCILNKVMTPLLKENLVSYLQTNPFGFAKDGSSNTGLKKKKAKCALIFNLNRIKRVDLRLCAMYTTLGEHASTALSLFASTEYVIERESIP